MAEQSHSIKFDGYWRDENKEAVPATSGIYCVYSCTFDVTTKKVQLKNLIYIGESENINAQIANHEKYEAWKKYLEAGQQLCFTYGEVALENRSRCAAAMIFKHKPPENTEFTDDFQFDKTTISLSGYTYRLTESFTSP